MSHRAAQVARDFAAWNDHDLGAAVALTASDVRMAGRPQLFPPAGVRGHAAYRSWLESTWQMLPDPHIELADPVLATDNGTGAAAPWRLRGTTAGPRNPPGGGAGAAGREAGAPLAAAVLRPARAPVPLPATSPPTTAAQSRRAGGT
jgi:hypothetical protein